MVAPRHLIVLALTSLGFSGCAASLQDLNYKLVNKSRAEYAWYSSTSFSDRWNCGSDYAHGYKAGYYEAATGRGCVLPAVPPPCYWSTKYQSCEGQKQIQDWYRGYQCGVAAAQGSGYPSFHNVPIGPQAPVINKDGCGMCYAPSGCLCENSESVPPAVTQPPMIEHLPRLDTSRTNDTAVAQQSIMPIYQVSATTGAEPALGLIGPNGMSAHTPKMNAPIVRTADAQTSSARVTNR